MVIEARVQLPERWINPEILKWARRRMALDAKSVEALTTIPAERLTEWESGKEAPSLHDLEVLAETYDCPVGYFFLESPPEAATGLDFRGLAHGKTEALSYKTHLRLGEYLRLTDYVASLVEKTGISREVRIGTASTNDQVQSVAQRERAKLGFKPELRERWMTANQAFDFWRTAIEAQGVFVITLRLEAGEVRGASRWDQSHPPSILVNHEDIEAATGRTFTLLHEWSHLLLKRPGLVCDFRGQAEDAQIEHFSNRLAAEMLVSRQEFEQVLREERLWEKRARWGDQLLDKIRNHFKVSRDVVAILLEEIGLSQPGFYRSKRGSWDQRRPFFASRRADVTGKTKAMRRLNELGLPLARLISVAHARGTVSKLDLADILHMKVDRINEFVSVVKSTSDDLE